VQSVVTIREVKPNKKNHKRFTPLYGVCVTANSVVSKRDSRLKDYTH